MLFVSYLFHQSAAALLILSVRLRLPVQRLQKGHIPYCFLSCVAVKSRHIWLRQLWPMCSVLISDARDHCSPAANMTDDCSIWKLSFFFPSVRKQYNISAATARWGWSKYDTKLCCVVRLVWGMMFDIFPRCGCRIYILLMFFFFRGYFCCVCVYSLWWNEWWWF